MGWIFFLVLLFLLLAGVIIGILNKDKKTQKNSHDSSPDSGSGWLWFLNDSDTGDHSGSSDSGGDGGGGGGGD